MKRRKFLKLLGVVPAVPLVGLPEKIVPTGLIPSPEMTVEEMSRRIKEYLSYHNTQVQDRAADYLDKIINPPIIFNPNRIDYQYYHAKINRTFLDHQITLNRITKKTLFKL